MLDPATSTGTIAILAPAALTGLILNPIWLILNPIWLIWLILNPIWLIWLIWLGAALWGGRGA